MEPSNYVLAVNEESDPNTPVLSELPPYTQLKMLSTVDLSDGTKRALVVLNGQGERPLGWLTAVTAAGVQTLHASFRPLYSVVASDSKHGSSVKVSKMFNESSATVCQLPVGTRVVVLEQRRTMHGAQRVRVKVVGKKASLGWLTAKKPDGSLVIREVKDSDLTAKSKSVAATRSGHVGTPLSSRRGTPSGTPMSSRRGTPRGTPFGTPRGGSRQGTPRGLAFQSSRISKAASHLDLGTYSPTGSRSVSPRGMPTNTSAAELSPRIKATLERLTSKGSSMGSSKGESGSDAPLLGPKSSHQAVEKVVKECMAKQNKLISAAMWEAQAVALEGQAAEEEGGKEKALSVQVGEILMAKKVKVDQLVREWDPKDKGIVSKQEFRVHIRNLFAKKPVDTQDVDDLFMTLDDDGGGTLDIPEIKAALKKLKDDAADARAGAGAARARGAVLRKKAAIIREGPKVAALETEKAATEFKKIRKGTVGSRLVEFLHLKGIKAVSAVSQWDTSGDGELSKVEFRQNVMALGMEASAHEVDDLFDDLDSDGGGSLDLNEVKRAFKKLQDQAENKKQALREKGIDYVESLGRMQTAQIEHQNSLLA